MTVGRGVNVHCPICSAENAGDAASCFLCGQSLVGAQVAASKTPGEVVAPAASAHRPTFRISTMMLLIAVIAVFLGLANEGMGWAVLFAIPTTIALFRTLAVAGHRGSGVNHVAVFLATFAAVVVVAVAAVATFLFTCFGIAATGTGRYGGDRAGEGIIIGGIAALAVAIGLTVVFVRISRRKKQGG